MSMRGTAILLSPLRKPLEGAVLIRGLLRESEIEIGARNRPTKPHGYMPRASGYPANPERHLDEEVRVAQKSVCSRLPAPCTAIRLPHADLNFVLELREPRPQASDIAAANCMLRHLFSAAR